MMHRIQKGDNSFYMFLLLAACAPPSLDTSPSIAITWPPPEQEITSCVTVVAQIENFTLMDATNAPPVADGQGHFHVEYPGGYQVCYKPYCLVDLSKVSEGTPTLTTVLVGNDHQPILKNGNRIEDSVPIVLSQGMCSEGTPVPYDTGGDSGTDSMGM